MEQWRQWQTRQLCEASLFMCLPKLARQDKTNTQMLRHKKRKGDIGEENIVDMDHHLSQLSLVGAQTNEKQQQDKGKV